MVGAFSKTRSSMLYNGENVTHPEQLGFQPSSHYSYLKKIYENIRVPENFPLTCKHI